MSKQVVVIDYGVGNVFSVCNALARIGAYPILSGDPAIIEKAERVILPGVGAFSTAMDNLRSRGLDVAIANFINKGRPFLGICIGMQLLMDRSSEFGNHFGLGFIKGSVELIPNYSNSGSRIKVPHIGWGQVNITSKLTDQIYLNNFNDVAYYYFVHSFVCKPLSPRNLLATVSYHGNNLTAIIGQDNILGVQFHPERSGPEGLRFLHQFLSDCGPRFISKTFN
jgi:glutamine amidotransferase